MMLSLLRDGSLCYWSKYLERQVLAIFNKATLIKLLFYEHYQKFRNISMITHHLIPLLPLLMLLKAKNKRMMYITSNT